MTQETITYQPGGLVVGNFPLMHRPVIIAAGVLKRGTVLGPITASDKYIQSLSAANDGSEEPECVLAEDVDASGGDVVAPAYFTGDFDAAKLIYGAGHSAETVAASWRQKARSLFARTLK